MASKLPCKINGCSTWDDVIRSLCDTTNDNDYNSAMSGGDSVYFLIDDGTYSGRKVADYGRNGWSPAMMNKLDANDIIDGWYMKDGHYGCYIGIDKLLSRISKKTCNYINNTYTDNHHAGSDYVPDNKWNKHLIDWVAKKRGKTS